MTRAAPAVLLALGVGVLGVGCSNPCEVLLEEARCRRPTKRCLPLIRQVQGMSRSQCGSSLARLRERREARKKKTAEATANIRKIFDAQFDAEFAKTLAGDGGLRGPGPRGSPPAAAAPGGACGAAASDDACSSQSARASRP